MNKILLLTLALLVAASPAFAAQSQDRQLQKR